MIHENREEFRGILERASAATGFPAGLLEKDYYLTIMLNGINKELDEKLVFKGGTCLNKLYFDYFRLSEDLDFTLLLPDGKVNKTIRSRCMDGIKKGIKKYLQKYGLILDESERPGRNESRQYVYYVNYDSIITGTTNHVKLEIGLRANPFMKVREMKVKHVFKNPFSGVELFDAGTVKCLSLIEIAAEKFRAAATRKKIAPRDFFDLDYLIKKGVDFKSKDLQELVSKKMAEDGFTAPVGKYYVNLFRTAEEIRDMELRLEDELYPVLAKSSIGDFRLDRVIKYFNAIRVR